MADKVIPPSTTAEGQPPVSVYPGNEKQPIPSPIDPYLERRMLRKIDLHLIAPLWILFMLGFMDRINLGNVRVLGILKELHLTGNKFNIALQVFFVPYILLEIPSNIALRKLSPSTWIAALAFLWGIACMCQGFVHSNGGLIACRFFLGVFEAGFVPGSAYLMSMYYKRHEFQKRFSLFWCAGLVAGAFGGLLAYGLVHMQGLSGYSGWRWIFIIEGLLSIAVAIPAKFLLADWPEQARFLSRKEKNALQLRNSQDVGVGARMDRLDSTAWRRILTDWKVSVGALMYTGVTTSGYATALFVPTIVNSLGYSGVESQVHSIPIWIVAAVVTFATSILTDRLRHRYAFIMFGVAFASIGYIILLCQGPLAKPHHPQIGLSVRVRYMAVFFVCTGTYISQPVAIVWLANNLSGHYKRAIGLAVQVGFGNIGGIIASNIFQTNQSPHFYVGYSVSLGMLLFGGIMATVLAVGLTMENKKREGGERAHRLHLDQHELGNLGDDDPRFRFSL